MRLSHLQSYKYLVKIMPAVTSVVFLGMFLLVVVSGELVRMNEYSSRVCVLLSSSRHDFLLINSFLAAGCAHGT